MKRNYDAMLKTYAKLHANAEKSGLQRMGVVVGDPAGAATGTVAGQKAAEVVTPTKRTTG